MSIKNKVRKLVNLFGIDIIRLKDAPSKTLLGLRNEKFNTIIDIGVNKGQFSQKISTFFPQANIYCFEPLSEPFNQLSEWAKTQNGRVRCFNTALGEENGEIEMHMHDQHSPSSSLLASTNQVHNVYPQTQSEKIVRVKISTLDSIFKNNTHQLNQPILIKLDVQGFEDRVLRGGNYILSKCHSIILEVSLASFYEGQANFQVLSEYLYNIGFEYAGNLEQIYDNNGNVLYLDAIFKKRVI